MGNCLIVRKGSQPEGTATPSKVLSGYTFQSANSDKLQTGTLTLERLKNSIGDATNSYTFTKAYDYAVVTASQAREGNRGTRISISANNCTITEDSGASYYNIGSTRESSIRTYIVKNIVSGSSISVYQQGALVGLSITAMGGVTRLLNILYHIFNKEVCYG